MFSACHNTPPKEKTSIWEGTYQVTETGQITRVGIWVFSKDEISILISDKLESAFSNLGLAAVQKYYIKDHYIYTCLCNVDDCLDKEKNYEKIWKIESVRQTKKKRTIMLTNVFDASFKVKLEKDKSIGLDVRQWE